MANSTGQRIGAFLMASLFLLIAIGSSVYVIYEINRDDAGLIVDSTINPADNQEEQQNMDQSTESAEKLQNFTGPVDIAELRYDDVVVGSGEAVPTGATVTIHYTGALAADGTVFDSSVSAGQPKTFPLTDLIQGWQQGIPGMKAGGKRRLYLPSDLGYGSNSREKIPADSDLVFDIELFSFE